MPTPPKTSKDEAAKAFSQGENFTHHIAQTPATFLATALQNPANHYILMSPADEPRTDGSPRPLKLFDPAKQPQRKRIYALTDPQGLVVAAASTYDPHSAGVSYDENIGKTFYLLDISVREDQQGRGHMKTLLKDIMADFEQKGLILGGFFTKHEDSPKLAQAYSALHSAYPDLVIDYEGELIDGHAPYSVALQNDRAVITPHAPSAPHAAPEL